MTRRIKVSKPSNNLPLVHLSDNPNHYHSIFSIFFDPDCPVSIDIDRESNGWPMISAEGTGKDGELNTVLIYKTGLIKRLRYKEIGLYKEWVNYSSSLQSSRIYSMLLSWKYDLSQEQMKLANMYESVSKNHYSLK